MKFLLFSKISFEIPEPIALIECYCYQNDFYAKYDLLLEHRDRKIEDVNKIGARIKKEVLLECSKITERTKSLSIFKYNLKQFLSLEEKDRNEQIEELNEFVIDFYKNLQIESNRKNLNHIFNEISKNNLKNLTRIRIFDILWWSYLKAEKLREEKKINWSTIK